VRFLLSLLTTCLCFAADLPSGESLIRKALEGSGGEAAIAKVKTAAMSGSVEMGGGSLVGTVSVFQGSGKSYTVIELPGIGKIEEGFDGETAWEMNAIQGVRIKDGTEKALAARNANMSVLLGWRDLYTAATTLGEDTVDGRPAWQVELTPKTGKPETFYFDKESGLPVRMTMTVAMSMGEVTVDERISDYRLVSGIRTPFQVVQKAMNQALTMKFDKVEYNGTLPPDRFELPAQVKTVLERRKAAAAAK